MADDKYDRALRALKLGAKLTKDQEDLIKTLKTEHSERGEQCRIELARS